MNKLPPMDRPSARMLAWLPLLGALPAVVIALIGFSAHDSGAFEPVPCGREVAYHTKHAKITDQYIKGYVEVSFDPGVTIQDAIATLDSLDAHWAIDYPYHHYAWVCTLPGEEVKWENTLRATHGVQYVHQEGVHPLSIEN